MKNKFKGGLFRKVTCVGLTAVMAATFIAGQAFAFADRGDGQNEKVQSLNFSEANGKVDLTDIKLSNLSPQVKLNDGAVLKDATQKHTFIIELEGDSLLETDKAESTALKAIVKEQNAFLKSLDDANIKYTLKHNYYSVMNGVAIEVELGSVPAIKSMGGVSAVTASVTYERPKDIEVTDGAQENASNMYKNGIYDSSNQIAEGYNGEGMSVAILDTGLDYTHEAFSVENFKKDEEGNYKEYQLSLTQSEVAEKMEATPFSASTRSGATVNDVWINEKVPFAYDYADKDADVYPSYSQHGTHVAGIVAGEADSYVDKDGNVVEEKFKGVAPKAQLVICKVFTDDLDSESIGGAEAEDIVAALDDCVRLGVDVINMSLGTSCGFSSAALGIEGDEEGIMLDKTYKAIRNSGISLIVAASNDYSAAYGGAFGTNLASNPDSGTVGSPSTFDGAVSVASINGQRSPYILANAKEQDGKLVGDAIYYEESRNEDSDAYNFLNEMLGEDPSDPDYKQSATYKYVVIPGIGDTADYTASIRKELNSTDAAGNKIPAIAVVRRGTTNFQDKIRAAADNGAVGVIVYNNVSGMIRMSLGDMKKHIPSISVSMEAGLLLTGKGATKKTTGTVTLDRGYTAGPFMNDYSSWGTTPDLLLKPDVTAHGGEITSTVAGGYAEMSGTSMACPNLAGFTALTRGYLKKLSSEAATPLYTAGDNKSLTNLTNNIIMSTATIVYDQNKLPYSPRKQGAGLATLGNVFNTKAYLRTALTEEKNDPEYMCQDGRPKAELGDDPKKNGVYNITFYVENFGDSELSFKTNSIFMTEELGVDGKSVAEKAHVFSSKGEWTVNGVKREEGESFTVAAHSEAKLTVQLKLSASDKKYLNDSFVNGMFIEGFLQLKNADSQNQPDQCDLTLPFMGFYGDWQAAPMLDLTCYEVAADAKDASLKDEERRQASVFPTQAFAYYWNDKYVLPIGSFLYNQDEKKEHTNEYVYTDMEHGAISKFNEYYGSGESSNYLTSSGIKALYAGLLRNAELVTYTLKNVDTGEIIREDYEIYRVGKAHSSGGSSIPAQVLMEMRTEDMPFEGNGKYSLDFKFYFNHEDATNGKGTDDTFSMTFYVDYEAPILVDSRIRFVDRKQEGSNKDIQDVYLDLDIYDNHYPQAVLLCYTEEDGNEIEGARKVKLATEYITPILNPKRNTTNTLSINITDIYEDYKDGFYVEIDDYAMNNNVYYIDMAQSGAYSVCPEEFAVTYNGEEISEITIQKNQAVKLGIKAEGNANASNYIWKSENASRVAVKNGEIFGLREGNATVTVEGAKGVLKRISVKVEGETALTKSPTITFGTVKNYDDVPVAASGIVRVNPAQQIKLNIVPDPWYYPVENLEFEWTTSDKDGSVLEVDQNGNVSILYEGDEQKIASVTATAKSNPAIKASVSFMVMDPFTVSNGVLTRYRGWGGEIVNGKRVLTVPTDKSIMTIGSEAFKESEHVQVVVVPKAVTTIEEDAFKDCKKLEKICFISEERQPVNNSSLFMIERNAFSGCTALKTVDLTNCKVITLDRNVFTNCTALEEVIAWERIGTAGLQAFAGCTKLKAADISKLHVAGDSVFMGCTSLESVTTGKETAMGANMFAGCTALKEVTLNSDYVPANAFKDCTALQSVTLGSDLRYIGNYAFANCGRLTTFNIGSHKISSFGSFAFSNCAQLTTDILAANAANAGGAIPEMGQSVFEGVTVSNGELVIGNTLVRAAENVTASALTSGVTKIGAYAFSQSKLASGVDTIDLTGVTEIGEGAFANLASLKEISIPATLTKINKYAFSGTGLESVTIPVGVTSIGDSAFYHCASLANISFNAALTEVGKMAFSGTAITELNLPASVTNVGNEAFAYCDKLTTVTLPAVKKMGEGVFAFCTRLASATFGEQAETTGTYTFFAPVYASDGSLVSSQSALTTVSLGGKITSVGSGAFAYCDKLVSIDLNAATTVEDEAFYGCSALATVAGLDKAEVIGANAFAYCSAIEQLDLSAAKSVSYRAFLRNDKLASIKFGSALQGIGDEAFIGAAVRQINLPASCYYVGVSAFRMASKLEKFTVDGDNKYYFADQSGVLYRYIDKQGGKYELTSYPANLKAEEVEKVLTYKVKEGTVNILTFAFGAVPATSVAKVVFPYSLKTIGASAFDRSGVTNFEFESIQAPTLLENVPTINGVPQRVIDRENSFSPNSFYYDNFSFTYTGADSQTLYGTFVDCTSHYPGDTGANASRVSPLKIFYPTNGVGYDNFVYSNFFGKRATTIEQPEDGTRELKDILTNLEYGADDIKGWNTSNKTKAEVVEFSNKIIRAHSLYNTIASSTTQLEFVGQENIDKMFAVESALKPVKKAFGIAVRALTVRIDESSAHKTEYRVGEKFSLKGLKLLITFDDFSTEVIDAAGNFEIEELYRDKTLTTSDEAVTINGTGDYIGKLIIVKISVVEGGAGAGLPGWAIAVIVIGCALVVGAGVAVTLILIKKKRGKKGNEKELAEISAQEGEETAATQDGETVEGETEEVGEEVKDTDAENGGEKTQTEEGSGDDNSNQQ